MGLFTANAPANLQPFDPPLGINPRFCVNVPTTLVIKEHAFSLSGDNFTVKDSNGVPVVICQGKAFSLRDRKVFMDPQGQELYHLRNKMIAIHKTLVAEDAQEREVFRVAKRFALGTKMEAKFINTSNQQPISLELRGDFWGGSADISLDGRPVAQISRQLFNARELFVDKQTYFVTVAPGVDLSLIAGVCIAFDEAKNENSGQ